MTIRPFHAVDTAGETPTLVVDVQNVCRELLADGNLSESDAQLLRDVQRNEGRYRFRSIERLLEISASRSRPELRERLAETMRAHSQGAPLFASIDDVFDAETRATAECDVAQLHHTREQSPHNLARAIEAGERQLVLTRTMVDRLRAVAQ